MPSANLDLVRSVFSAWERADFSSVEWAHPEIEYVSADALLPVSGTGVAGMAKAWRNWLRVWEDFHAEADEYRELDGERVLVLAHFSACGKWSGLEVRQPRAASLFHLRDGKVTRLVVYLDRERALADLGVAPEAGSPHS
jgi:ketosteroid isomerase-like protein